MIAASVDMVKHTKTKRERQFYYFGIVCGLVNGITKLLMQNMCSPVAKRARWYIARLDKDCPTDIRTEQEKNSLLCGYERGKNLREVLEV